MQPSDFSLVIAAARKEAERLVKSQDRAALMSFAPVFEIRGRNLWMMHAGVTADLGLVVAEKGDLGPRGVDGNNGRDGLDGKSGIDGQDGRNGADGRDGVDGNDGAAGKDGVGVSKAYVSDAGYLILEFTDGRKVTAGYVKGKDGKDGKGGQILFGGGSGSSEGGGGASAWGDITGTLSAQTDLQSALDAKASTASLSGYQPLASVLTNTTASYTTAEAAKLSGIASGATANSSDATLLNRANHTGTQLAATISDFSAAVAATAAVTANTAKVTNATHTGDATGATALTLATVNSNVGAFGSATQVAAFTVNAKGLTTAASAVAIAIPSTQVTDFVAAAKTATAEVKTTFNYTGAWQSYAIPALAKELDILIIGPGGNGAAGFSRAAGNPGGGGGGGGAGSVTRVRVRVSELGVSTIYAFPGQSSGGNISYVSIANGSTTAQDLIGRASAGANATAGTASAAGGAGAAGAVSTIASTPLASLGIFNFTVGQIGAVGGVQTGATGVTTTWGNTGITVSGGGGGAGCTTTDFAGGRITGTGAIVAHVLAGTAGGGAGQPGVAYSGWNFYTGGSGGGSNNSGTGGVGGAGNIGSGGGGGGAGVTGGAGGAGGNGFVQITAIF